VRGAVPKTEKTGRRGRAGPLSLFLGVGKPRKKKHQDPSDLLPVFGRLGIPGKKSHIPFDVVDAVIWKRLGFAGIHKGIHPANEAGRKFGHFYTGAVDPEVFSVIKSIGVGCNVADAVLVVCLSGFFVSFDFFQGHGIGIFV